MQRDCLSLRVSGIENGLKILVLYSFHFFINRNFFIIKKEMFVYVLLTKLIDCLTMKQGQKKELVYLGFFW